MFRSFLLLCVLAGLTTSLPGRADTNQLCLVLVGDSTMCDWPLDTPKRGWGQFVQGYFINTVSVTNLARSGRSTKTFIREGRWTNALSLKPDFVLIQFGHNDSHAPGKPESTDAATDYKEYLRRYVDDSRAVGATPILITPMCRRTFDAEGKLKDALLPYANAMKEVATEKQVALIDLHASSRTLFEKIGPEKCPELANAPDDFTHFNEKGARAMAELVMIELPRVAPSLQPRLASPPPRSTP